MKKISIIIVFLVISILLIIIVYPNFQKIYYKTILETNLNNQKLNNFSTTTYVNKSLNTKTYTSDNKLLCQYFSSEGINDQNIYSDYNKRKTYFYNPENNSNLQILDMESTDCLNTNSYIYEYMNDSNKKIDFIEKSQNHYILKFTDKTSHNTAVIWLNSKTYLEEKYILFTPENNEILLIETDYEFNINTDNKFPHFE
jgi:hypothetical protein